MYDHDSLEYASGRQLTPLMLLRARDKLQGSPPHLPTASICPRSPAVRVSAPVDVPLLTKSVNSVRTPSPSMVVLLPFVKICRGMYLPVVSSLDAYLARYCLLSFPWARRLLLTSLDNHPR